MPILEPRNPATRPLELPQTAICHGRDSVTQVLQPILGPDAALERANNIAQALVFGVRDATQVATDMLRHAGLRDTTTVAAQVDRAWHEGIRRTSSNAQSATADV